MGGVERATGGVGGTGMESSEKEKSKARERERKRENVTAGELRQSIRLPGPKELELGFAE